MNSPRLLRILSLLAWTGPEPVGHRLCVLATQVVDVAGAGVMLEGTEHRTPLCASDAIAARIEDLCLTLGEGPGVDAHRHGVFVLESDLAQPQRMRWPNFSPLAVTAGVAAIFSFPLRVGAVHLGTLTLYNARPGRLSDDQHDDAMAMATVVLNAVLAHQAGAPPGVLARELESLAGNRAEVHQASGMVSVQLAVSVAEALVRLRARAYADDRPLADVARDIVDRRLRLEE